MTKPASVTSEMMHSTPKAIGQRSDTLPHSTEDLQISQIPFVVIVVVVVVVVGSVDRKMPETRRATAIYYFASMVASHEGCHEFLFSVATKFLSPNIRMLSVTNSLLVSFFKKTH